MNYNNGDFYEGEWRDDMKEGYGRYAWANGSSYQGHWEVDRMNGKGQFTDDSGKTVEGRWVDNDLVEKLEEAF